MFDKNSSIIEVLRSHPQARDVFVKFGMSCIGCMGSTWETIASGAKMHGIDEDALLKELNDLLFEEQSSQSKPLE